MGNISTLVPSVALLGMVVIPTVRNSQMSLKPSILLKLSTTTSMDGLGTSWFSTAMHGTQRLTATYGPGFHHLGAWRITIAAIGSSIILRSTNELSVARNQSSFLVTSRTHRSQRGSHCTKRSRLRS